MFIWSTIYEIGQIIDKKKAMANWNSTILIIPFQVHCDGLSKHNLGIYSPKPS